MLKKIQNKINSLLNENIQQINVDDRLVTTGLLNSLKIVELVTWIEEEYGVHFSEIGFNIYDFETILTIIDLIKKHQRLS